jgi:molybdopterin biosynthesis enzyme
MQALDEAARRLRDATPRLASETWPVEASSGRIIARDVWSPTPVPPHAVAARAGFALRHRDAPGRFEVWGSLASDERFDGVLGRRRAVRVDAGTRLPQGATAVVTDRDLPTDGEHATVQRRVEDGEGVLERGAELDTERPVLAAGARLRAPDLAVLVALGHSHVEVQRRPRVAIATRRPHPAAPLLEQQARAHGLDVVLAPEGADVRALARALGVDLLLQIGGPREPTLDAVHDLALSPGGRLRVGPVGAGWATVLESSALGAWAGGNWLFETLIPAWTGAATEKTATPARLASDLPRDPRRRRVHAVRRTRAEPTDLALPVLGDSPWSLRSTWGTISLGPADAPCPAGTVVRVRPWP